MTLPAPASPSPAPAFAAQPAAHQIARALLVDARPVIRPPEEQTWDATDLITAQDQELRQFWDSRVPGSGAPECLMAGALQSLENKGLVLPPYHALLAEGRAACAARDHEALLRIDTALRRLMRAARPDPAHPSQQTRRYATWADFAAAVDWPADWRPAPDLDDRLRAGWLGQLVGAAAGTALEGYTAKAIAAAFGDITDYVRPPNTYNDDITFEIAFLEAFEAEGLAVSGATIAANWAAMIPLGWSAEGVALASIRRGLLPPETGRLDNPFDEWIGAQMRGTICGMVVPGRVRLAAELAWRDGEIAHSGNGILGGVFNAMLAAAALAHHDLAHHDLRAVLAQTIALIPAATEYGAAIRFALAACETAPDWQTAWAACDARYAEYNWIHVLPNACAQVVGLWWGGGDFDRTLAVLCGIGHDADCNAAQMLCILGLLQGSAAIAPRWTAPLLADDIVTYMRRPARIAFADLVARTATAARRFAP